MKAVAAFLVSAGIGAALLLLALVALAAPLAVVGSYQCAGTDKGKPYDMELDILPLGDTYEFAWRDGGQVVMVGLAVPDGDHLAVALVSPQGGIGVAHYAVRPGRLDGVWAKGDGSIQTERCQQGRNA